MASAATHFLGGWIQKAHTRAPSVTRVTCQRWPGVGVPPHFKPGIASYGWGINGHLIRDSTGHEIGLSFSTDVWFSDRGLDLTSGPPEFGQQFASDQRDSETMFLTIDGNAVKLRVVLNTWHTEWTVSTTMIDTPSQQLIFSGVPGAGPNAPQALMVVAFADTGNFGWL